jgi:apolipoprotein N-acyltransferase
MLSKRRRHAHPRAFGPAWRSLLSPALGGLALALAFPSLRAWPLVFLAWVPLWVELDRAWSAPGPRPGLRRTFLQGWIMGMGAFPVMMIWLLALSNEEVTIPGLMIPSLLLIGLYLGLFFGLSALISSVVARWSGLPLPVIAPAVTALVEYVRSLGPLGFPWGAPAYALARVPGLIQIASGVGFWGLVFVILWVNGCLAAAVRGRRWGFPVALATVVALAAHGGLTLARHPVAAATHEAARGDTLRVLVAQPDIRREIKWKPDKQDLVVELIMEHARAAAARAEQQGGFDLFVWPETVFPMYVLSDPAVFRLVRDLADSTERPILMGTLEGYWQGPRGAMEWISHNSVVIVRPSGELSPVHRKLRLVPFSERMPLQQVVPWLTQIDFGQSNFYPGTEPVLLETGRARIGCLICFESAFPDLARAFVRRGANVLVLVTNDFWFGRSAGPAQHADMSILRAVENHTWLVRCANTGISMLVDPYGRVSHETAVFTAADFVETVSLGAGSFASRHPDWFVLWLALLTAAGVLAGVFARRRGL